MKVREPQKGRETAKDAIQFKKSVAIRSMVGFHYFVMVALFLCCWIVFYRLPSERGEYFVHDRTICAAYVLLLAEFSRIYASYKVGTYRVGELVHGQVFANLMSWGIVYFLACIMAQRLLNPLMGFACIVVQSGFAILWTIHINRVYYRLHKSKRTVVFYRSRNDLHKIEELAALRDKWQIVKYIRCLHHGIECDSVGEQTISAEIDDCEETIDENIHRIMKIVDEYESVFVAGVNATLRNGILKHCVETKKDCYFIPHTGDVMVTGATHMKAFSVPVFHVERSNPSPEFLVMKRLLDICVAGSALLVLWPFMLITALLIRLYDHGPALYKQTRLTKNGKPFKVLNLRWIKEWYMAHKTTGCFSGYICAM